MFPRPSQHKLDHFLNLSGLISITEQYSHNLNEEIKVLIWSMKNAMLLWHTLTQANNKRSITAAEIIYLGLLYCQKYSFSQHKTSEIMSMSTFNFLHDLRVTPRYLMDSVHSATSLPIYLRLQYKHKHLIF